MKGLFLQALTTTMSTTTSSTTSENALLDVTDAQYWKDKLNDFVKWSTSFGIKLLLGLILLFVGWKIISSITKKMRKRLRKKIKANDKKTAAKFGISVFNIGLKIALLLLFLAIVGIPAATIVAAIASCGVAIGLALQGSLSNLAGGLVIVIMKPFRIGDYVEAQGEGGTVEDINMFYTYLATPDNRTVMIPNGVMANGVIRNNSLKDLRRVDFQFDVSYDSNIETVKNVLLGLCANDSRVIKEKAPFVEIGEYKNSSILFKVRVWTKAENYWDLYFDFMRRAKELFDENNIVIPYDKLDVTIKDDKEQNHEQN